MTLTSLDGKPTTAVVIQILLSLPRQQFTGSRFTELTFRFQLPHLPSLLHLPSLPSFKPLAYTRLRYFSLEGTLCSELLHIHKISANNIWRKVVPNQSLKRR